MLRAQANRLAVLIPAYRPSDSLVDVVRALVAESFPHVVVVDDGSGPGFHDLFAQVAALPGVVLLRHAINLGKGAALKTGINYTLCNFPEVAGVVTADADGQHHPDDIERVAESLLEHPENLVLGYREFKGKVPWRSRIGNTATSAIVHALMGRKIADTQTGLRGLPAAFAARILKLEANGYEFELEMLLAAHKWDIGLTEEPIRTIYQPGNPSSHFNPIMDSMKIYFILLRFGSVSLLTALLDNLIFILLLHLSGKLLPSQMIARIVGVSFNYTMVRRSVFYSRQKHLTVLPKYLLLALVTGSVSYGGVRLLGAAAGLSAIPAKLIMDTLLFLVDFAVERLLIFKPGTNGMASTADSRERRSFPPMGVLTGLVAAVFVGALAMEAHGFRTAALFSQDIWEPIGAKRFLKYIGEFLGVSAPFLIMAPWAYVPLISGLTLVGTAFAIGPLALLAVIFYLISSCALGSRLLGRRHDGLESQLLATLLGAAVWIFVMNVLARMPVNYPAVWAVLLAAPIALDLRGSLRRLEVCWRRLRGLELRGYGERVAFALMMLVLLAQWFVALMPEVSADGLATHLAVAANIAANHAMTFEPSRFVWAVMPMGADFSYAIVYLFGGEYATHLLDYSMLLLVEAAIYFVIRRWVCRPASFLLLALFASTPLVQLVTGSLFVENVLTVMIVGMLAALWRFQESGEKRFLYLSAMLGGTAMTTKFGALAFVALTVPFLIVAVGRHWKSLGPRPALVCACAGLLLVGAAAPPYAVAYAKTGNPLFPFLSEKIPSKFIPPNAGLVDERFKRPLTWDTPYDLTFRTNLTYEGRNGSFGFQYLVLAPLCVAAILVVRRKGARMAAVSATVVALGAAAIVMRTQPNARYIYEALPLLSVPFAALLDWAAGTRWLYRSLWVFLVVCIVMNLRFMPSASYYHRDFCLRLPFSMAERDRYRASAVPIREVIDYFNSHHPHAGVMMSNDSAIAGLIGDIYENHWHQIANYWRIRDMKSVPDMVKLMQSWNVQYFISPKPGAGDEIKPLAFREMLERCTELEFESGDMYLASLQPACRLSPARTPVLVKPGFYDDFDPALVYDGVWQMDRSFTDADRQTISFSDDSTAQVQMAFEGKALVYTYTKAPNRGIASITIDGVEQGPVDLYSPSVEWQTQTRFCCFGPGRHTVVLRVTGRGNPKSSGTFIDLDSFVVE